jgi:hypothetical protein
MTHSQGGRTYFVIKEMASGSNSDWNALFQFMMHVTMGSVSVFNVCRPERTHFVLVQPEMDRGRSPLVSIPPRDGDFQGIGSTDTMEVWGSARR